ncbi:MAG: acyltransferase [Clostridia bacterium]|nr:acyltransferase [Clostridia bacterium]
MLRMLINRLRVLRDPIGFWRAQGVRIGEGCDINPTAAFGSEPWLITLGDHVRVTQDVEFVTHDGGVWVLRHMDDELADADSFGPITVGSNVHIGMHAIIMPGVHIGSNCVIGAGAIVTKDVPDNSVAAGVPARVIRSIGEYTEKLRPTLDHTKHMSIEEKRSYLKNKYRL